MVERGRAIATIAAVVLAAACGAAPPTPTFDRAEVVANADALACSAVCAPRAGERVEACHLGSLEPALLERRESLADRKLRRAAFVCLYRRQP